MVCKHFGSCGSCALYNQNYTQQLQLKEQRVSELLSPFYTGELELFDSPDSRYRARAEFRIWHESERCDYAMGNIEKKGAVTIEECPKVIEPIEKRMWKLLEKINASQEVLKQRLFAVEFLATTTDECLVTMLYHRKLDEAWSEEAKMLERELNCRVMGRSRKQKVILSDEFVTETLEIDGKEFTYVQYESGFTQPNPAVNVKMIEWAIWQAKKVGYGDFLESYCGLGNFTLPLSHYFDNVLATEISKRSIHAALQNCELNAVENITFARLASEEMTEALNGVREFSRLKGIDLKSYDFSTVLVDPPRAGLDEGTIELISNIDNIIYISCNPETLARDLETLIKTHTVMEAALFDQFPHTEHVESGVFLQKK
ncbi:tRNA (uridine(54)-C5)-methyltransferase TrmA [Sulfurovum sp. NBC37-1]|uniref:tRNA/tmRNA (uracil-C(5))-methyltransferase n=1 Tax=Sulfurovum sp. (strain NBC37-1) TaxID=387093 RepID=TRMA_SULNB|nr:tRNA (uridine(54)-C5)-methyltransferase TrmA [Sulfurovum sp. NBC37-1]A6QBC0.1 RecName: Full=tRNA/tmRNA (uracil-C(5))-methyltransferase; AltName: Full=tRNA (uracil(54)-C(5))-methyltransferase; AltName: Full=tRNA(m5U54)-methyltransferase; Short=RUMT; AltName: Full=tmRNA (uracil(341)-C(5))-methyltransferase [Sulfurovum sp. NBC37-1]BAF72779.1 tRNA (uracil-5-)-methyltransferase [Sulfurovum sp. NBC37-1]